MKYVTAVAHGRDGCARGERQQPAPRSRSARSSARAEAMRPTSAYSAATARVADSICECVRGFCAGSRSRWRWLLGAAGRRKRRTHGMPRRPTPHERSTSPAARLDRACSAAMYAAARPRVSSTRPAGSGLGRGWCCAGSRAGCHWPLGWPVGAR